MPRPKKDEREERRFVLMIIGDIDIIGKRAIINKRHLECFVNADDADRFGDYMTRFDGWENAEWIIPYLFDGKIEYKDKLSE